MTRIGIWQNILAENWHATNAALGLAKFKQVVPAILLFLIYVVLIWTQISPEEAVMEMNLRSLAIWAVIALYPLYFMLRLFITLPEREVRLQTRIARFRERLTPKLRVEAAHDGKPSRFNVGNTVMMASGDFQSNVRGYDDLICLNVFNDSERSTDICDAYIIEMQGDNGNFVTDPIRLWWRGIGEKDGDWATIPSHTVRTLKMFKNTQRDFYFASENLPIEYVHFFANGKIFTGSIALQDRYYSSLILRFELDLSAEPYLKILGIKEAMPLSPKDIEAEKPD
ncbi:MULTISPECIES: hypothetical protein [Sphingobium]|uniref:Uncharacterized protein n=1 Tax=Sphingobium fuliginis (strain ATCC 27551) TaxID=336203 RepID=A0ABQ1EWC2_SPHSA|nr:MULTISPECIES: hypothetical protein [Sphingobium]RYL98684.1 hypothetical protein EWH10_09235 [Sphingobium fuliginis]WDA37490.1 hypothetical protein PO876_04640 [Sphingobium sp. YC-XJ3]GFZ89555.1 hypothetical protein GCM10019071_19360 [Sphingobium fuliginis]